MSTVGTTPISTPATPLGSAAAEPRSERSAAPSGITFQFATTTSSMLGLRPAARLQDPEALLAQISALMSEATSDAEGMGRAVKLSAQSTLLQIFNATFQAAVEAQSDMVMWAEREREAQAQITSIEAELADLQSQRGSLTGRQGTLQSQLDSARALLSLRQGANTTLQLELTKPADQLTAAYLSDLWGRTAGVFGDAPSNRAGLAVFVNGSLADSISSLTSGISTDEAELAGLEGQIAALDDQIADATGRLATQQEALVEAQLRFQQAEDRFSTAINQLIYLIFGFLLGITANGGAQNGALLQDAKPLEESIAQFFEQITGRSLDQKDLALTLAFLEDALPADQGNPNKVVDRLAGFAGSIAVIQGALKQVLFGATSSTQHAADVSGRLRLTV